MAMFCSLIALAQQRQLPAGPTGSGSGLEVQYSCRICLEVYHQPVAIGSCGHTFCGVPPAMPPGAIPTLPPALRPQEDGQGCPHGEAALSYKAPCRGCNKKVAMAKMRVHVSSCVKVQEQMANCPKFVPMVPIPNWSTFTCPYCGTHNLDQQELVKHYVDNHGSDPNCVMTPICSAMPWGDPSYKRAKFLQHLHRCKFSFDTFMDYSIDEEAAFQAALALPLSEN